MDKCKFCIYLFLLYVLMCLLNPLQIQISIIGKIGKILIPIFGIFCGIMVGRINIKNLLIIESFFIFFYLGAIKSYLADYNIKDLAYTIIFNIYILYYFVFVSVMRECFKTREEFYLYLFKKMLKIIIVFYVFGFAIAYFSHVNFIDIDPTGRMGFGGFYGDRMAFGLLSAATLMIVSIIIIITKKINWYYFVIIIVMSVFIIMSRTRTPEIIALLTFIYLIYKLNKIKISNQLKILSSVIFLTLFLSVLLATINDIDFNELNNSINRLFSGRLFIWELVLSNLDPLSAYGLFVFNDKILESFPHFMYYFQQIEFLYFHNSFIEMIAGGSVFIILVFIIILYFSLKNSTFEKSIVYIILMSAFFESFIVIPHLIISMLFWLLVITSLVFEKKEGK